MKIFKTNRDINKNAYLNWNTDKNDVSHNFYVLATDFEEAATTMMHAVLLDNTDKKADSLIMPIFYCIDQSIEVFLKAVITLINEIEGKEETIPLSHDIQFLYNTMRSKIKEKERSIEGLQKHFEVLDSYIKELYGYIKNLRIRSHKLILPGILLIQMENHIFILNSMIIWL